MDWEVQYTHVCEWVSRKTSTNIKTGLTEKCNIPKNVNGYPGKDKYKYQDWTDWEVQYTQKCEWVFRKRQVQI